MGAAAQWRDTGTKACTKCGEVKPVQESFYWSQEGYPSAVCRACVCPVPKIAKRGEWRETGLKTCPRCKVEKTIIEFTIRTKGPRKGHPAGKCKACATAEAKKSMEDDHSIYERIQWPSKLRRNYGIEPEDYYQMLEDQGGGCAICKVTMPGGRKGKFAVDHNHDTGEVRGLLCGRCNRALGMFDDKVDVLKVAIRYLEGVL